MGSNASFGCLHFFCFQGQSKEICKIFGLLVSGHTNHRRCQMHASQLFSLIQHMEVGMAKVSAVKVFFRISCWCTIASIKTYQLLSYALRDCVMTKNGCAPETHGTLNLLFTLVFIVLQMTASFSILFPHSNKSHTLFAFLDFKEIIKILFNPTFNFTQVWNLSIVQCYNFCGIFFL